MLIIYPMVEKYPLFLSSGFPALLWSFHLRNMISTLWTVLGNLATKVSQNSCIKQFLKRLTNFSICTSLSHLASCSFWPNILFIFIYLSGGSSFSFVLLLFFPSSIRTIHDRNAPALISSLLRGIIVGNEMPFLEKVFKFSFFS